MTICNIIVIKYARDKKAVPLHAMEAYEGRRCTAPHIPNLGTW